MGWMPVGLPRTSAIQYPVVYKVVSNVVYKVVSNSDSDSDGANEIGLGLTPFDMAAWGRKLRPTSFRSISTSVLGVHRHLRSSNIQIVEEVL